MKKALLDLLICPRCLPGEIPLQVQASAENTDDLIEGRLICPQCVTHYPVKEGVAHLDPQGGPPPGSTNRYETPTLLSSYLWSHYGDLWDDEQATDAYRRWAELMTPASGACLDTGCAVGRFSFEMARKFDLVVGIDNSVSFIRACRELLAKGCYEVTLPEEGMLTRKVTLTLPEDWPTHNLEFIVADAQALPFRSGAFAGVSSLNVVDKVPQPLLHLKEINRLARSRGAQLLFSDPFSWSSEVAPPQDWLGGTGQGLFAGRGRDNIVNLLEGRVDGFFPTWKVVDRGHIWWKIRTHSNHFELIRSCFIKASR